MHRTDNAESRNRNRRHSLADDALQIEESARLSFLKSKGFASPQL
jgi:hypothetical protein